MAETVEEKAGKIESTIMRMGLLIPCLAGLNLELVLDEGSRMETIGPLIDPTGYMKHAKQADQNLRLARILRDAREEIKEELGPELWEIVKNGPAGRR